MKVSETKGRKPFSFQTRAKGLKPPKMILITQRLKNCRINIQAGTLFITSTYNQSADRRIPLD
jgi:hypothetical protein